MRLFKTNSETDSNALTEIYRAFEFNGFCEVNIDGCPVRLEPQKLLGRGGSKSIYNLGDGYAIAIPNLTTAQSSLNVWERMLSEECALAKEFSESGVLCQNYTRAILRINDMSILVIKMKSFSGWYESKGIDIREKKRSIKTKYLSDYFIFHNKENIMDKQYWLRILKPIIQDIVNIYSNGLEVQDPGDSYAIAVSNTEVRLFFTDFSVKHECFSKSECLFLDEYGALNRTSLKERLEGELKFVKSTILSCLHSDEIEIITGDKIHIFSALELNDMATPIFEIFKSELLDTLVSTISDNLERMPFNEKDKKFVLPSLGSREACTARHSN